MPISGKVTDWGHTGEEMQYTYGFAHFMKVWEEVRYLKERRHG
jgi:hypothetical protein